MSSLHAARRFGLLGPRRPGDEVEIVLRQVSLPVRLPDDPALPDFAQTLGMIEARREWFRAMREGRPTPPPPEEAVAILERELSARLRLAVETEAPLHERLVAHWANYFTVGNRTRFEADMERHAIRPNLLGRFEDLLRACTTHPAMLGYLNNVQSIGPNSPIGARRGRGLNENLARELLELHTLGADGGYTQQDVVEVARILTGWTVPRRPEGDPPFFVAAQHEPGPKTVLGRRYAEAGPDELHALLRDLAMHPSTARNVSRRLVRHFLGDTASLAILDAVSRAYLESGGDLAMVTRALVSHPESWSLPPHKLRPPAELLFAVARMMGGLPDGIRPRISLRAMGQPWQDPASPAGWPEGDDEWAPPDAIKTRLDWALLLAERIPAGLDARSLADAQFGEALSADTRRAVHRAANGGQALALLVMSPEVQRR